MKKNLFILLMLSLIFFLVVGCGDAKDSAPVRINANNEPSEIGNYVLFGSYPQRKIIDETLVGELTKKTGTLPTVSDSSKWTAYDYYIDSSNETNFMWYIDVKYEKEMYRGVYFTSYRPWATTNSADEYSSKQSENGYKINNIYWFKYEPIKWEILQFSENEIIVLSVLILDSQDIYHNNKEREIDGNVVYSNNYEHSSIRAWLNDDFYNLAFSSKQQSYIIETVIDNSKPSTGYSDNPYACNNTNDKIWLLSYEDVYIDKYKFPSFYLDQKQATDYAKCMGLRINDVSQVSNWWLRSPYNYDSISGVCISKKGNRGTNGVTDTGTGLAIALKIK